MAQPTKKADEPSQEDIEKTLATFKIAARLLEDMEQKHKGNKINYPPGMVLEPKAESSNANVGPSKSDGQNLGRLLNISTDVLEKTLKEFGVKPEQTAAFYERIPANEAVFKKAIQQISTKETENDRSKD